MENLQITPWSTTRTRSQSGKIFKGHCSGDGIPQVSSFECLVSSRNGSLFRSGGT